MKSYTDISQSLKLAEFLPLESADMYYPVMEDNIPCKRAYPKDCEYLPREDIECWSLASLLDVLPRIDIEKESRFDDTYVYRVKAYIGDGYIGDWYDNPVNACYKAILKLHELNWL